MLLSRQYGRVEAADSATRRQSFSYSIDENAARMGRELNITAVFPNVALVLEYGFAGPDGRVPHLPISRTMPKRFRNQLFYFS